ncbi:MAG: CRISPR-associated helicase Cas3' [Nitrosospira sp.]|nr:CRISPR-associated helicase Cas3' [Nitrosospira sp.]
MKETSTSQRILAHVTQDADGGWREHSLEEHLREVSLLARDFAQPFGGAEWAALAGLWHDLGKYREAFQRYIKSASGYAVDAHLEGKKGRVDHSTAGAIHAIAEFGIHGRILAYLIAGHHAGLPDWYTSETAGAALSIRVHQANLLTETLSQPISPDILRQNKPAGSIPGGREGFALWVRMLFSCLTDADFLDTERFMDENRATERSGLPQLSNLRVLFERHMAKKSGSAAQTSVNRVRAEVLRQCRARASDDPGLFSLTVPTGGGKTLSSMAFALDHAIKHGKRRIIYAIPYTSIIEQTAKIFRDVLGDAVIAHHSNLDPDEETVQSRLATENWDAPVIVTTNVQFLESLFAARTSRCRKLHNIVNSVVVLDEAQLLPPEFLQPILNAINLLTKYYGVTFVFSTATQPALNSRSGFGWHFKGLEGVREIMQDRDALYCDLERVTVRLPDDFHQPNTWEDIAQALQQHESVLCIVNSRADCRELHRLMPKGTVHLSALMCGAHRSYVLAEIKQKLKDGEPVRVISTQLVEAGVDIDFPIVYRAMAGLDSIHQAAGRCNREGRFKRGTVWVFVPPKPAPAGLLLKAEQAAISMLFDYKGDPLARALLQPYFEKLYAQADLDEQRIGDFLKAGDEFEVQFRSAAAKFNLVDESGYQPIFVPYGEEYAGLLGRLEKDGPKRWLMRKLQRYSVSLPQYQFEKMRGRHDVRELWQGMFALSSDALYHVELGVLLNDDNPDPASLCG